jgi:putative transposase/transposase-like zinc-binding protein
MRIYLPEKSRGEPNKLKAILILGRHHWDRDGYDEDSRLAFIRALQCKTPALGGRLFGSDDAEAVFYNTCKSRACSSCGQQATIQWQRERWCALPEGRYLGVTLTMPNTLWPLFANNSRLYRKLPEIAARVIMSYARVRKGVEVGVTPVLHTFNGQLHFKPHVHSLVTGGGLNEAELLWQDRIFFRKEDLVRSWQRLVLALLRKALEYGLMPSAMKNDELEGMLEREGKRSWIGHVQAFEKVEKFLRYVGRYVRRPPIAASRIIRIIDGSVEFCHKDKRECRWKKVKYTIEEFIDLWSQHIPRRHRHSVRHFGLFAPRRWHRAAAAVFRMIGQSRRPKPRRYPWAISLQQKFGRNPLLDSKGQQMNFKRHLAPSAT